ncbi:alpha-1,4-glucan:alpha-1,4-glucan 6-glycosyltransferase [Desulfosporosinus acidiphilus SJ4]|uniref:1,4-alpha-glucan branching enzyme GlgB n=1 Tax=Desulfosporosinus acidiphilus (strain DSM 22704 / JCM 16185 / SJ4) TaxID=646529 RepID=I4D1N5_DESAJ|nr:1,4-alpha-glucan branching protein GlgB [Desulfosporosinus acidiphilus]AFM39709.1 alpha-1,4-glucan:alpha-1,4-glucan 6-glycosyltransferase [Desulfosporosinus acidiphilus SJ4]
MEIKSYLEQHEIYLFNRGELFRSYSKFGAHLTERDGIEGTHFAVWVPDALNVGLVGEFNNWDSANSFMVEIGNSGVWILFVPEVLQGQLYKYEIHTKTGQVFLKSDPFAFFSELRPATASIVYSLEGFDWQDQAWMSRREKVNVWERPLLIYEVHLGSWRRREDGDYYNWRTLAEELPAYALKMGYTHIELMPIMEHPYDGSWGYQVTGYYSCTSRFGTPHDFMYFVNQCHQVGIGVILDWVPGHFCKDAHGLGRLNGMAVFERTENDQWGTYNFDFAKTEIRSFLISNAMFWLDKFHIDGLRVDGVSSMLYLDFGKNDHSWQRNINGGKENLEAIAFMQRLNKEVLQAFPGILMIAEESTDWPLVTYPPYVDGLGYNYKWNMGWMNDTLRYMSLDFPLRQNNHQLLTFSLTYAFSENFILPLSHDEVVHGKKSLLDKMPGDYGQKFAGLRSLYGYWMCHPGKKLVFMGGELAQFIEWRDAAELDWFILDYEMHRKYHNYVRDLNKIYQREKALWENEQNWSGFEWIDVHNHQQSILIFCRKSRKDHDFLIILINFQDRSYDNFRLGVPSQGGYQEILNSDAEIYGGTGHVNKSLILAEKVSWHGRKFSLTIKVAPLATIILKAKQPSNVLEEQKLCLRTKKALSRPI